MATRIASRSLLVLLVLVLGLALLWTLGPVMPVSAAPAQRPLSQSDTIASPNLAAPEEAAVITATTAPPVGVPTLKWQAVPGADRYNVQISVSAGFANPAVDVLTFANTYSHGEALADGLYYWRVRAQKGREWGAYSEVRSFTKDWCDGGKIFPMLLGPLDDTTFGVFANDDFHWDTVPGAATYVLEIATDETFSTIVYEANTIKPHHTPTERLGNNRYYWRVTPVDHQDHRGQASPIWSFVFAWNTAPQPLGPADGLESAFLPTFSWTAVEAAEYYQLEISTQPFPESASPAQADSVTLISYKTANTEFTPEKALSNDQEYFWRVKAIDNQGTSSPYSVVRRFKTRWNFQPRLLTPLNNSIQLAYASFSWTAIPGVERYHIQIDKSTSFDNPVADVKIYNATTYGHPTWKEAIVNTDYYWHVRGVDAQDNFTPWSDTYSFRIGYTNSPTHVYPLYYYEPDAANMPVHSDRTIAWPVFAWDTSFMYDPDDPQSAVEIVHDQPDYYVLEVTSDPTFLTVNFQVETAGLSAAPTLSNSFNNLEDGKLYYWRVRAMKGSVQFGSTSVWVTRIDRNAPQFTVADAITPIYPRDSFEAVEAAPVLGWLPVKNAARYRVQVSRSSDFSTLVDEAIAQFVNYTPWQGRQTVIPFGTYWWRVRAEDAGGAPIGGWSGVRHFNVSRDLVNGNPYDFVPPAASSSILSTSTKYDPNLTFIADSPNGPKDDYEIGKLHVMLDRVYNLSYNWVFAFEASPTIAGNLRYGIYVDSDHVDGSGATTDPLGKPIQTGSLYRPEYVIYLSRIGQTVDAANALIASWNGSSWDMAQLSSKGGESWFSADTSAVQILVPYTALGAGADEFVGSLAVTVFSTAVEATDGMRDSIPEQGAKIDRPAFVTNMLMPLYPFDTPYEDPKNPIVFTELPSLRWRMPTFDSVDGYEVQVARDARFTDLVETWETYENKMWSFYSIMPAAFHSLNAYEDNESYYWRVRIRHERYTTNISFFDYGPWSPAMRFKLTSKPVGNPTVSTGELAQTTPSFRWQRVEGPAGYTLYVDDDANFSNPIINENLDSIAYTPLDALPDGHYYWKVATRRSDKVFGQWTTTKEFTKRSIAPIPIAPIGGVVINTLPTFTWKPVFTDTATMRIAAPQYRVQFDDDPNFSQPDTFDTESTSLTISKELRVRYNKFMDGYWYWRVAVIDAKGNVGAYSPTQQFYKEYLRPVVVGPKQGQATARIPNFQWEPLDGAAYYEIRIAENENDTDTARPTKTDNASFTPTSAFSSTSLFWRVQMYDDDGVPGPSVDGRLADNTEPLFLPLISNVYEVYQ